MLMPDQLLLHTHPGSLKTVMQLGHLGYQLLDSKMSILFSFQSLTVASTEQKEKMLEKRGREIAGLDYLCQCSVEVT